MSLKGAADDETKCWASEEEDESAKFSKPDIDLVNEPWPNSENVSTLK